MQEVALLERGFWSGFDKFAPDEISTDMRRKGHLSLHCHSPSSAAQSSQEGREDVSGVIVPDPQVPGGTPMGPRLLEGLWSYTDGMKAPAKLWTLSEIFFGYLQCCHLFGFPQQFLQGCLGWQGSRCGASGGAGAVTVRLWRGALLLLDRLGKAGTLQGWFLTHCGIQFGMCPNGSNPLRAGVGIKWGNWSGPPSPWWCCHGGFGLLSQATQELFR